MVLLCFTRIHPRGVKPKSLKEGSCAHCLGMGMTKWPCPRERRSLPPSFLYRHQIRRLVGGWVGGCLTSQQHASLSQGRICSDNFTCCHTEIEVTDQTFHLTQSQYTDTGPTSPSTDPITPGAWQGSHWGAIFLSHWYDSTPENSSRKRDSNPGSSSLAADALTARPTRWFGHGYRNGDLHPVSQSLSVCLSVRVSVFSCPAAIVFNLTRNWFVNVQTDLKKNWFANVHTKARPSKRA